MTTKTKYYRPQSMDNLNIFEANNLLMKFLKESPYKGFRLKTLCHCFDCDLKRIGEFANSYDDSGELTLLYLCSGCKAHIDDTIAPVGSILDNPDILKPYADCKALMESPLVNNCKRNLANKLSAIIAAISGKKLLGDGDAVFSELDNAVDALVDEFPKLRFEVYMNSGHKIDGFNNFSSSVQVCNSLAEMLLRLEKSNDGIYVGYVSIPGTLDGWFGFFCKSNGNLFSYNERIDEAYVGQHNNLRNGRYVEGRKAFELFPYELCKFSDECDYKGYSTEIEIGENRNLFDMKDFSILIRTILSMAIISRKHAGRVLEGKEVVVDSLLPSNLAMLDGHFEDMKAIVKLDGSQLVKVESSFKKPQFEEEKVLAGFYDEEFRYDNKHPKAETGWFHGVNQEIVDAYGEGFKIDNEKVLVTNSSRRLLGDGNTEQEFIGSPERFRLRAYMEVKQQLANYVRKNLNEDFDKFGGIEKLKEWYTARLAERMDKILSYCSDVYAQWSIDKNKTCMEYGVADIQTPEGGNFETIAHPRSVNISEKIFFASIHLSKFEDGKYICPILHHTASLHFLFSFNTWKQVEEFLDCDLPKFCVGWRKNSLYNGNYLLNVTDPVGNIVHPLHNHFDFSFSISLSKRAIAKKLRNSNKE